MYMAKKRERCQKRAAIKTMVVVQFKKKAEELLMQLNTKQGWWCGQRRNPKKG